MARARPAAASSSGRPSYAESFASRRRRQARAPANQQTSENEQDVVPGCVWRHGLSGVAREETEDSQEDAVERSCLRHWHNLQKCRDLQNMNLEVIQRDLRAPFPFALVFLSVGRPGSTCILPPTLALGMCASVPLISSVFVLAEAYHGDPLYRPVGRV